MKIEEIELEGNDVEHHFEYLLEKSTTVEDDEERQMTKEELAEQLIREAAFTKYVNTIRSGQ